ncbi:GyrI-like small molecule binding domain-containing protein [Flavobacterium fontis]|uniref:GyrI-like small molecule binding domain-containing protein n=1 Tax=Flavobacterium fontis TaxID=1124188 RepID=A0A1M5DIG6_9FLAO|nr:GyrI-like domain-containing protein [Flavobacterium fontis]SHF66716.1 GyrI-like small molecule binding domain-containing protein [Flavobacterium fontis]
MKILRYLFFIALLFLLGTAVFVATQKPSYSVTKSLYIKNKRAVVFDYVNDLRNWETFAAWIVEHQGTQFKYPESSSGKNAHAEWTGSRDGNLKTLEYKDAELLRYVSDENGQLTHYTWQFKDTLGGTKVQLTAKGTLDFNSKIKAFFQGGVQSSMGNLYERTLVGLEKSISRELKTFQVKVMGLVNQPRVFYLKQFVRCKAKNLTRSIKTTLPKMQWFFKKNAVQTTGKPFIIYHKWDKEARVVDYSVCIPVKDTIAIEEGSDIAFGVLPPFKALRVQLKGDYSHLQKAWNKGIQYINTKKWARLTHLNVIEIYRKNGEDTPHPSQWMTEVYLPVQPTATRQPRTVIQDTVAVVTPNEPAVNSNPSP